MVHDDDRGNAAPVAAAGDYADALALFTERAFAEPGTRKLIERALQRWAEIPPATTKSFFTTADPEWDVRPVLPMSGRVSVRNAARDNQAVPRHFVAGVGKCPRMPTCGERAGAPELRDRQGIAG